MDSASALVSLPAEAPVPGLVSVTLVVYNGERDVGQAIDSVLGQNYSSFEVIAVDDGSTDGTWEVLRSYGDRIRAVRQRSVSMTLRHPGSLIY